MKQVRMKVGLHHNTWMRIGFGAILWILFPGILFLLIFAFAGWRWGLVGAGLLLFLAAYGFFLGWRHITVKTATCSSPLLPPAFEGYRILQLSDLHIGTFLNNRSFVQKLVRTIQSQKVDLMVFTGDLVNVGAEEVIPFMTLLDQLHAPDGVLSVMGNHDYCEYGADQSRSSVKRNQTILHYLEGKIGWKLLMNDHLLIHRKVQGTQNTDKEGDEATIAVIGVENISRPPFQDYGDLAKAMAGLPKGMFKILLSHDPSYWRRGVLSQTDIALTLSGHTHAGQLRIGRFSPVKWVYREWGGKYTEGGRMLFVSPGVGGTVPFRIGAWPEVNIIELHTVKK